MFAVANMGCVNAAEESDGVHGVEVGVYLSVKDCCRELRMNPALYNPAGHRRHYSEEQLDWVRSLIADIPKALRHALAVAASAPPPR